MNKQLSLAFLFVLVAALSVSAISASDVNVTDSYIDSVGDDISDVSVPMDNTGYSSVLSVSNESNVDNESSESGNSNNLSTNSDSNSNDDVLDVDDTPVDPSKTVDSKDVTKIQIKEVVPTKDATINVKSTTVFTKGSSARFLVELKSDGSPLAGKNVVFTINGKTYTKTTNSDGLAALSIYSLDNGKYTMSFSFEGDSVVKPVNGSTIIQIKEVVPTKDATINVKSTTVFTKGSSARFLVELKSDGSPLAGKNVVFTINGKTYTKTTNSDGLAALSIYSLDNGKYTMSFSFEGDSVVKPVNGSTIIQVKDSESIEDIVAGATNLKKYYETNKKLPSTVTAGGVKFTLAEFTYLMAKAIDQLGKSDTKAIAIILGIADPSNPSGDNIYSVDLSKENYLKVALNVANYMSENKAAPNYASSTIGNIIYSEYVDAFSRILAFYEINNRLPNSVIISYSSGSDSGSGATGTGLNEKNTETDLDKYLKATKNCQVGNSAIKSVVDSVTKGLTSVKDKATAIFNYVRDKISYSFYYDTKYGAAGTLSSKKGNCVDSSHLLVAMFRTTGIPARYVHGSCTFSSGSTYGHVWVQVLVDGQWTVADATSSRNSLGKVANWNTKTFSLTGGTLAEISF